MRMQDGRRRKKIRDEYRKIVNVKKAIYKKVQVKNERKN